MESVTCNMNSDADVMETGNPSNTIELGSENNVIYRKNLYGMQYVFRTCLLR